MAAITIEQKALSLCHAFERSGKIVTRVVIEGRKIEVVLQVAETQPDEFERIDMRHDKA
jgi:hypothetical protein